MLTSPVGPARTLDAGRAVAVFAISAAVTYSLVFRDPNVCLLAFPFLLLGCGRGKRPLTLLALSLLPALLLLLVSVVKFRLVGMPLVAYDHLFLRSNVLMLAYNDWRIASGLVLFAVLTVLYLRALLRGRGPFTGFERAAAVGMTAVAIYGMATLFTGRQSVDMWDPANSDPTLVTLLRSTQVPPPSLQVAETPAPAPAPVADSGFGAPAGGLPDLFLVLQESTFNPARLRPGYAPKALFAKDSDMGGAFRVHTFAGGTWRTEFSVAIQMRPQEFGSDGLYVFQQLPGRIKRSIFTELKKLGYRVMVFYPVPGSFINAQPFYASIGADEFYDPVSLGVSNGWNWKSPDSRLYQAMLDKLKALNPGPFVAVMLTINQHGPHDVKDPLSDYLGRFEDSDRAYQDFLGKVAARGRKAGVVAFGDHHPEFTARFLPEGLPRFLADYDLRCINFTCAGPAGHMERPLDAVMLMPAALERFGFTLDQFSLRQREVFQGCEDDIDRCGDAARLKFNAAFLPFFD
ncbi:MAG: sulfatase-like hydrolase/transferase [Rhodospirillaceae bacterium]|nr:sulfatase-like hydrolase/transferase [Rhodospirillaceae bacterium]